MIIQIRLRARQVALLRLLDAEAVDGIHGMDLVRAELLAAGLVDETAGQLLVRRAVERVCTAR